MGRKYECGVTFKGSKENITKLIDDINNAVSSNDIDHFGLPNALCLLDNVDFDYIGYSETEREKLWEEYKSRGGSYEDFLCVYKEDLKTNFNAEFEYPDQCFEEGDNTCLTVDITFDRRIDPRLILLVSKNYSLDSFQYTGYNQTTYDGHKGSYNDILPEETTVLVEAEKPDGDGSFVGIYTDSELDDYKESRDDSRYFYHEFPLKAEENIPLVYGMFYSSDVYVV